MKVTILELAPIETGEYGKKKVVVMSYVFFE
jgi:hypothetical protein